MSGLDHLNKLTTKELMERTGFYKWEEPGSGYPFGLDYGYTMSAIVGNYSIQWHNRDANEAIRTFGLDTLNGEEMSNKLRGVLESTFGTPGIGSHWEVVAQTCDEESDDGVIDLPDGGLAFDLSLRDAFLAAYEHYLGLVAEAIREVPEDDRMLLMEINA